MVVDSSVWIDYFNGTPSASVDRLDQALDTVPIVVGDLILTEVLQGFTSDADFVSARRALEAFEVVPMLGHGLAVRAAENYRTLRRRGLTVRRTIAAIIGTYCLQHGHALLFDDRDFQPFIDHLGLVAA